MGMLDTIKDVVFLVQKADNIDLLKRVLELQTEALDMFEKQRVLEAENRSLKQAAEFAAELTFRSPFWFHASDPIPYCPRCWEGSRKASHMQKVKEHGRRWDCLVCEKVVLVDGPDSGIAFGSEPPVFGGPPRY